MRIALFGATGGTGRQILAQAQGHSIRALVRDATKLRAQDGLELLQGDVLDATAVLETIRGAEAVISVLGSHGSRDPIEARGTAHIIDAMRVAEVRRLLVVTSLGVGESRMQLPWIYRLIMELSLKDILAAKAEQERLVKSSGLDWTIIRPGGLTNGPRTGRYRYGVEPSITAGRIARADVADFVLRQLCDLSFLHQTPAVT